MFEERRDEVIREMASRFEKRPDHAEADYRRVGFDAIYLLAKLEERRRGLGDGTTIAAEEEFLRAMTAAAVEHLGTPDDPGPWSWNERGSPAIKQAALAFGWILHQYGDEVPEDIRENIRAALEDSSWSVGYTQYLINYRANIMSGRLLAGEHFGYDSSLWQQAKEEWNELYERNMSHGGLEKNAPIYTSYIWSPLTFLNKLEHEETRNQARILCDHNLIFHGHLYMPGGHIGFPQSRDRSGAIEARGSLTRMFAQFVPELPLEEGNHSWHQLLALGDYLPAAVIRSFFTDKGDGYTFWGYTDAPVRAHKPEAVYMLGPDQQATVSPWQVVFAPAGDVKIGFAYGLRFQGIQVSMGVLARDADGQFHVLYQAHPWVRGDTMDTPGRSMPTTTSDDPYDWIGDGYDFERLMVGRTLLSLWNPTLEHKREGVVRTHQDTRVHIPNYANFGGEMEKAGDWFVGRMGETYIAYRPLGPVVHQEPRDGGNVLYMTLDGKSGGIFELATTEQFPSLAAYAENLNQRHFEFERDALHLEFDALDPDSGDTVRLRLEHYPQRRFIEGREYTMQDLDRGLVDSPWVRWDPERKIMTVEREGIPGLRYHIPEAKIEEGL